MATTIVVTCPECKKQMKASDELAGKKIRCKGCDNVFAVKVPGAKSSPAAKPAAKDKASAIKSSKAGDAAKPEAAKFTVKKKKRDDD